MTSRIIFTQFLRPHGKQISVTIAASAEIYALAMQLISSGYRFEAEELSTGEVSFECCTPDGEDSLAIEICANGPPVVQAVEQLVRTAAREWEARRHVA